MPTFNLSSQVKTMAFRSCFSALLLSLMSLSHASLGSPLQAGSGTATNPPSSQVWEAVENGTDYKIIKVSDERFLIAYGNNNNISGYISYDQRNGPIGTEYVPWASISSDVTIGIQGTSSQSIGVMLSIDGETTSFVARPYRPRHKVRDRIRPGKWSAIVSGTSMQILIAPNLVDVSIDIGKCRLNGKIKSSTQDKTTRLTLSPATMSCPTTIGHAFDAALLFSEDLAVVYTTERESINFIFVGPEAGENDLNTTPQPRHTSSCTQWRAMCRAKCSATPLPTGNFGFKFWNCVNSCNALAGC
ncbi:hypothetical protein [Burkholderia anthina]|uniref:hypothetical protein n=1 Tax=Burkholderia anthina TaxID=179879 RepID=UPI00158E5BA4|nr:hypothetical protein [Burkholderia anthina]